jgi:hypothetical protein
MTKKKHNLDFDKCLKINNEWIKSENNIRLLGVMIDDKLNWNANIDFTCKKMNKKFYLLKRCDDKLNCQSKILFFNSLVAPHIDYCSTLLFLASDSQINELQKIQNRFMRLILKLPFRTHTKDLLEILQWFSVKQRIYLNTLKGIGNYLASGQ